MVCLGRLAELRAALKRSRVVALIGPRQSGKTTLARQIVPAASPNYFDLEDPVSLARLAEPMTTLAPLRDTLTGFSLQEVGARAMDRHWRRGGFPQAFLARSDTASLTWRRQFTRTFLERDLPALGVSLPPEALLRFFTMIAHYHGGAWNAADPARSLGVSGVADHSR